MNNIKSLADQLRSKMAVPDIPKNSKETLPAKKTKSVIKKNEDEKIECGLDFKILTQIQDYDSKNHKSLVHVRFDEKTAKLLGHFKMATEVDVSKLVAFSVHHLFQEHPELKSIIKQFIQELEI